MQKLFAKIAMVAMLGSMLFVAPVSTQAVTAPLWDVTGTYVWDVFGAYFHDFTISTQNPDGTFVGTAGYPAGGAPYTDPNETTETVTGQVVGNTITFTVIYQGPYAPGSTFNMTGTIDSNGHISGTSPWNWQLTGGNASPLNSTVVVTPSDVAVDFAGVMASPNKWFFYNDENDSIDNSIGSFVNGPEAAPLGLGSAQMSVTGSQRRNLATYQFKDVKLSNISTLQFSTYSQLAEDGALGLSERAPYLQFNVDFDNSNTWQRRLTYVPALNGAVVADEWQTWDAIKGGNAMWTYSGSIWPGTGDPGTSPKTWAQILALYPNAETRSTDSFLGFRVGEPYADGFTGNVDNFVFGTNAGVTTFDFDPVPPNQNPVANAGPDQTITLPTSSVTLDGSGSTDDGSIVSYTWTQISGPSVIYPLDVVGPTVSGLVEGTYVFQLVATDNLDAVSTPDTVSITVAPIPAPTNKDQCKNDGWKDFTGQSFKNQGQCVAYTNHLE